MLIYNFNFLLAHNSLRFFFSPTPLAQQLIQALGRLQIDLAREVCRAKVQLKCCYCFDGIGIEFARHRDLVSPFAKRMLNLGHTQTHRAIRMKAIYNCIGPRSDSATR